MATKFTYIYIKKWPKCKFKTTWGHRGEVYSIQHYLIKFVSDLRHVGGFLQVLQFPPPIQLTATI